MPKPNQELISKMSDKMPCVTQAYDQKHGTYTAQEPSHAAGKTPESCCSPFASIKKR